MSWLAIATVLSLSALSSASVVHIPFRNDHLLPVVGQRADNVPTSDYIVSFVKIIANGRADCPQGQTNFEDGTIELLIINQRGNIVFDTNDRYLISDVNLLYTTDENGFIFGHFNMTLTGVSAMQSSSTPSTAGTSPWADPQTRYCCRPFMAFRVVIGLTQPAFIPEVKPFKTWVACNPNRASRGDGRCRKTFSPSVTECNPTTATANIRAASVPVPAHPQVSRYEIAAQASGLCPQGYASTELASVEIFVVDQHSRARFIAVNRISIVNIESRRQLIHSGQRLIEIQLTARSHGEQQEWQNNEDRVCCKPIFRAFFWLGVDDLSFMYLPDATLRTQELVAACPPSVFSYADPHCQITPFNWPGEWPCTIQSKAVYNIPYGAQTQK